MWEVCRGCCTELAGSLRLTVNTLIVIAAFQKTFSCGPSLHQVKATKKTVTSNIEIQHIMFSFEGHTLNSLLGRAKVCGGGWKICNKNSKQKLFCFVTYDKKQNTGDLNDWRPRIHHSIHHFARWQQKDYMDSSSHQSKPVLLKRCLHFDIDVFALWDWIQPSHSILHPMEPTCRGTNATETVSNFGQTGACLNIGNLFSTSRSWMSAGGWNEHWHGMLEVAGEDDLLIYGMPSSQNFAGGTTLGSGRLQPRTKPSGCSTCRILSHLYMHMWYMSGLTPCAQMGCRTMAYRSKVKMHFEIDAMDGCCYESEPWGSTLRILHRILQYIERFHTLHPT